jgi:hypothetical protein
MALPKLNTVFYDLDLPYSKKTIQYRPFVVGEQKALMIAMETKDEKQIFGTMKQAIQTCTNGSVDVGSLPLFELEYLFINIRMKSVGEKTKIMMPCESCMAENEVEIDLRKTIFEQPNEKKDSVIFLTDTIAISMKMPSLELIQRLSSDVKEGDTQTKLLFDVALECIDAIMDKDNEYKIDETNKDELREFVDSLSSEQFLKIQEFLDNVPTLKLQVEHKCEKCDADMSTALQGIANFF